MCPKRQDLKLSTENLTQGPRCSAFCAPIRSGLAMVLEECVGERCPLEFLQMAIPSSRSSQSGMVSVQSKSFMLLCVIPNDAPVPKITAEVACA